MLKISLKTEDQTQHGRYLQFHKLRMRRGTNSKVYLMPRPRSFLSSLLILLFLLLILL